MDEFELHKSRELANSIRFSEDKHDVTLGLQPSALEKVIDEFYRSAVEINHNITPKIEAALKKVCLRLSLDREIVQAFVNNSYEVQAACYYVDANRCLIRISSSLVNLLSIQELEFVIGHELGHFLLQHAPTAKSQETAEYFVFQRAKEISADRIGIIGCGSLNFAVSALIKTASGLNSEHIQVSLKHYLEQLGQLNNPIRGENLFSTHPSMLIRTFAVSEFLKNISEIKYSSFVGPSVYARDKILKKFMDEYVDQEIVNRINTVKYDLEMWVAVEMITRDERFDKLEQEVFEKKFGNEDLEKVKIFLMSTKSDQIKTEIQNKIFETKKRLENIAPSEAHGTLIAIQKSLDKVFK